MKCTVDNFSCSPSFFFFLLVLSSGLFFQNTYKHARASDITKVKYHIQAKNCDKWDTVARSENSICREDMLPNITAAVCMIHIYVLCVFYLHLAIFISNVYIYITHSLSSTKMCVCVCVCSESDKIKIYRANESYSILLGVKYNRNHGVLSACKIHLTCVCLFQYSQMGCLLVKREWVNK